MRTTADPIAGSGNRTQSVPAVEKVFAILEVLARSQAGLTLRELAHECNVPKSTVHCIVITLERCGYLHRNQRTSRYLFGRKLFSLANQTLGGLELKEQVEPEMRALARYTRLSVHLGINEFDEAVIVSKISFPHHGKSVGSWIGKRMELHCTALGKALISSWSEADLARLARERTLSRHNDNTIFSLKRLQQELSNVRSLGYAVDDEEDVLGCRCVGAPVHDRDGNVVAALSVSGDTCDITAENVRAIAEKVRETSRVLSRSIASSSEVDSLRGTAEPPLSLLH